MSGCRAPFRTTLLALVGFTLLAPAEGKAGELSEAQRTIVLDHLKTCVQAILEEDAAAFRDWAPVEGRIPGSYMRYERFQTADGDFRAYFGMQRKKHGPFECGVIYQGAGRGIFSDLEPADFRAFFQGLDEITLADQSFERVDRFEGRINNRSVSACINGRWLLIGADASREEDGSYAPMYRVGPPLLEDAGCEDEKG